MTKPKKFQPRSQSKAATKAVAPATVNTREQWAAKIRTAHWKSVDAILTIGRLLIEAKAELDYGDFTVMIERDLPFSERTAQKLMAIAKDERLRTDAGTVLPVLPTSWTTLYELTRLPDADLERGIATGIINPDMERADVQKLMPKPESECTPVNEPEPKNTVTVQRIETPSESPRTVAVRVVTPPKPEQQRALVVTQQPTLDDSGRLPLPEKLEPPKSKPEPKRKAPMPSVEGIITDLKGAADWFTLPDVRIAINGKLTEAQRERMITALKAISNHVDSALSVLDRPKLH